MRFACLGSGSRGNATVVTAGCTRVLVDCGFSVRETERRLGALGIAPAELTAILVTHEHSDHVGGVGALARRHGIPVWATQGTWSHGALGEVPQARFFNCHTPFAIDDLAVDPFPVPHDAREPSQFVFGDGAHRLGILTDSGYITPHIVRQLADCHAVLLECNHDEAMLAAGPYPAALKQRVGGQFGHLSNDQAAALLGEVDTSGLQHVVAAHLSEQNNTPELARAALADALNCEADWIAVASQGEVLDWRAID